MYIWQENLVLSVDERFVFPELFTLHYDFYFIFMENIFTVLLIFTIPLLCEKHSYVFKAGYIHFQ